MGSLYYGLNHYRRIFLLEEDDLFRLADNEVDVVLPSTQAIRLTPGCRKALTLRKTSLKGAHPALYKETAPRVRNPEPKLCA